MTARVARLRLEKWVEWAGERDSRFAGWTPDQYVQYLREGGSREYYEVLDLLQAYVTAHRGRLNSKRGVYTSVRSFFNHNRVALPADPSYKIRSDVPRVVGELSPSDIRQLVLSANPCMRAVYLTMFQGGIGQEEFTYWNQHGWKNLEHDLEQGQQIVKLDLPGRKAMRNVKGYYTFIGGDALKAIRDYLPHRPRDAEAVFINQQGRPLGKNGMHIYWLRHLRRLGLTAGPKAWDLTNRTGRNIHEIRDVFRSQWAKSPAKPEVAEFLMGHVIDELGYNKAYTDVAFYRREYLKALPYLQILSRGEPYGQVSEENVDELGAKVQRLEETVRLMARELRDMRGRETIRGTRI